MSVELKAKLRVMESTTRMYILEQHQVAADVHVCGDAAGCKYPEDSQQKKRLYR